MTLDYSDEFSYSKNILDSCITATIRASQAHQLGIVDMRREELFQSYNSAVSYVHESTDCVTQRNKTGIQPFLILVWLKTAFEL